MKSRLMNSYPLCEWNARVILQRAYKRRRYEYVKTRGKTRRKVYLGRVECRVLYLVPLLYSARPGTLCTSYEVLYLLVWSNVVLCTSTSYMCILCRNYSIHTCTDMEELVLVVVSTI